MKKIIRWLSFAVMVLLIPFPVQAAPAFDHVSAWAQESMQEAYSLGWIGEDALEHAQQPITRGELCTIAVKAYQRFTGNTGVTLKEYPFSDVNEDPDVAFVVDKNILTPLEDTFFGNDADVTRQEMAQFLKNLMTVSGAHMRDPAGLSLDFDDRWQMSEEYKDAIKILSDAGVIHGYDNQFFPLADVTVEQAVVMTRSALRVFQPQTLTLGGKSLRIGDTSTAVLPVLGQPSATRKGEYGQDRYFYQSAANGFLMVGVSQGIITELYSNAGQMKFQGLNGTSTAKDASFLTFSAKKPYVGTAATYEAEIKVLFDPGNSGKLDAVYLKSNTLTASKNADTGDCARGLWELVNAARVKRGAAAMNWETTAAGIAFVYSSELAFSPVADYTNKLGETPFQRMSRSGIRYTMAAENIDVNDTNIVDIYYTWMLNTGSRGNLLERSFDHGGIGIYAGSGKLITTMDLYEINQ